MWERDWGVMIAAWRDLITVMIDPKPTTKRWWELAAYRAEATTAPLAICRGFILSKE